jgi:hypothetical protein
MRRIHSRRGKRLLRARSGRRGAATLDYILLLCLIFPLGTFVFWAAPRLMNLVYEMLCVLVSWPFM